MLMMLVWRFSLVKSLAADAEGLALVRSVVEGLSS